MPDVKSVWDRGAGTERAERWRHCPSPSMPSAHAPQRAAVRAERRRYAAAPLPPPHAPGPLVLDPARQRVRELGAALALDEPQREVHARR